MGSAHAGQFLKLLRSRHFRVAFLAFQFLWLNVVVPGHRRGIVSLTGTACPACDEAPRAATRACCASNHKSPERPPIDPAARCAICFFAARLSPAVAIDFTHPPLRLLAAVETPPTVVAVVPELLLSYHGRAPPVLA